MNDREKTMINNNNIDALSNQDIGDEQNDSPINKNKVRESNPF